MTVSATTRQLPARQRIRRALLLVSFLLFPVTLYYFSPILIMQSASEEVVNASFLVFAAMFVSSLFVGRLWCGTCADNCSQDAIRYSFTAGKCGGAQISPFPARRGGRGVRFPRLSG